MSAPVEVRATDIRDGCVGCGSPKTVRLHPYHGRECPDHVSLPAGGFDRDLAADMVDVRRADAAFAYLAAWMRHEIQRRFAEVTL